MSVKLIISLCSVHIAYIMASYCCVLRDKLMVSICKQCLPVVHKKVVNRLDDRRFDQLYVNSF